MKAGELKAELESLGISTKSFFEKSEFVKACAEARVDGTTKQETNAAGAGDSESEGYAEYSNVEVITDDSTGPKKGSAETGSQRGNRGTPSDGGANGNPFGGGGGGGNPFGGGGGGMGGMGGMEDILKNMGMGGMGGGGGDAMGKAQEMMKNPKVMEIIMKAQKNPRVAKAIQECMGNPSAFAKYKNDPEVADIMRELQQYM